MTATAAAIGVDAPRRARRRPARRATRSPTSRDAQRDARPHRRHGVEEQRRLVADASHELRTPLAAMRAEIDVSLRADDLPPAARDVLESAREEVDRLSRTVDDLLTLASVDEGGLELRAPSRSTSLDVARARRRGARRRWPPRAASRSSSTGEPAPALAATAERLRHAIRNLVENAIEFSPPAGAVEIATAAARRRGAASRRRRGPGHPARSCASGSSSASTAPTRRGRGRPAAAASAWRSRATSRAPTAGASGWAGAARRSVFTIELAHRREQASARWPTERFDE